MNFLNYSLPCAFVSIFVLGSSFAFSKPFLNNVHAGVQVLKFRGDPVLNKLKGLLEQDDLPRFYETVRSHVGQHHLVSSAETLAGDMLDKQLLIDQLAAAAPLFELNEDTPLEKLHWNCVMEKDIARKADVLNDLYVISRTNLEQDRPLAQKKETARLCSLYAAMVIRTMKDHYVPGMKKKNQEMRKRKEDAWKEAFFTKWKEYQEEERIRGKNWKLSLTPKNEEEKARDKERMKKRQQFEIDSRHEEDKRRDLNNILGVMEDRNSSIESFLKDWEDTLIGILYVNYPGKSFEVFNYLKLAGYKEDEMMEMVDRVEGRNKHTEFLYKSSLGRKFLKEKKELSGNGRK